MLPQVFLDTNILIDYLDPMRPKHEQARSIVNRCLFGIIKGCISETVVTNCCYILRKALTQEELSEFFLKLSKLLTITSLKNESLSAACRLKAKDLEDGILYQIALENGCEYFITSNLIDFTSFMQPELKVVSPELFLEWYEKEKKS